MTKTTETNRLEIAAIHPSKGAKYSPNLYRWLTKRDRKTRAWRSRVFRDASGVMWIGEIDGEYMHGSRLMQVLCNGGRAQSYAFGNLGALEEVSDFWRLYMRDGRCAIDTEHSMLFVGDGNRWHTEVDTRHCLWCGNATQKLRSWIEPVERSKWEMLTANAELTERRAEAVQRTTGA